MIFRMFKFCFFPLFAVLLVGCADNTMYYWGDYQNQTYDYFSDKPAPELIDRLNELREKAREEGKPLPPTFYAHLGLLYQKTGDTGKFKALLIEERKLFPESTSFSELFLKQRGKNVKN